MSELSTPKSKKYPQAIIPILPNLGAGGFIENPY